MDDELEIKNELEIERAAERMETEAGQESPPPQQKRMGILIFLISLFLMLLQTGVEWLTAGTIGWFVGVLISILLFVMLRPYTKSLKRAKFFMNSSLVIDAIPVIDLIPIDIVALVFTFVKSRSKLLQKVEGQTAESS